MIDDAALVGKCLKGERCAYDDLVRKYQSAAFGLAFSFVHNEADAADLVQDAFVKGYLNLEGLKDRTRFGAWIKTILVNGARKAYRNRNERVDLDSIADELGKRASDQFAIQTHRVELWEQVQTLDEVYREPIVLFYGSGMSYEEVADFLNVPVSTVRGRLQKARQKLKNLLMEDMVMAPVDVTGKVQDAICKIARAEINEEIDPGKYKHLALFVDVPSNVTITGGDGDRIVIRGHKVALGEDEEKAQAALDNLQLIHDEVNDWITEGQHPGKQFIGTDSTDNNFKAIVGQSGGKVPEFNEIYKPFFNHLYLEDVFPHLVPSRDLLARIRQTMPAGARRVSLITETVMDIVLPKETLSDDVLEGMWVNNSSDTVAHGSVGRVQLEVIVPAGVSVTVQGVLNGAIREIQGHVLCLNSTLNKIEDVEGNVFLLNAHAKWVGGIHSCLAQFDHSHPGSGREDAKLDARSSQIDGVVGDLTLDVSYIHWDIQNVLGQIDISNRMGNSTLDIKNWTTGNRCRIHSVAGDISLRLEKAVIRDNSIAGATLSGSLHYKTIHDVIERFMQANDQRMRYFSTVKGSRDHYRDAVFFVSSECGQVMVKHSG